MARSAAYIQGEITAIEALLASSAGLNITVSADGVTRTIARTGLEKRLDVLYQQLDRASGDSPMIVRGVVKGLR
jgi:hypothetical protein